jgi:hypothetical protein
MHQKPNPYAVALTSVQPSQEATQIAGNAFIRIKAKTSSREYGSGW